MDTLRGTFDNGDYSDRRDFDDSHDLSEDTEGGEASRDLPPAAIGQDERRMQVRAYNHWASLLGERTYPSIEDLDPEDLTDFGPFSVLLDFSTGIEDPIVQFLGAQLAQECGAVEPIERLSDVPPRSLLSRITDHYMQIMANQSPIGFEAEFVNQRGASILYRGILLPFSSDDESIDFIYGVINWKEMADAATADELLLEIDQALEADEEPLTDELASEPVRHHADPIADWADSPAHEAGEEPEAAQDDASDALSDPSRDNVEAFDAYATSDDSAHDAELPVPDFGQYALDDPDADEDEEEDGNASYSFASLSDYIEAPARKAIDFDAEMFDPEDYRVEHEVDSEADQVVDLGAFSQDNESETGAAVPTAYEPPSETSETQAEDVLAPDPVNDREPDTPAANEPTAQAQAPDTDVPEASDAALDLQHCLAAARELAQSASASEDRSRQALYAAVGQAYDVSLAAKQAPAEYEALIEESGLTVQDRAPMTPIVKLVFGSDYDKTRLTEYAACLGHAHRLGLERGALADYLGKVEGGLKGVVNAERRLRREESGKSVEPEH
ncbi:MAG: hypothetical protein AAFQ13_09390, partial [Pseudomonadota bacterium]